MIPLFESITDGQKIYKKFKFYETIYQMISYDNNIIKFIVYVTIGQLRPVTDTEINKDCNKPILKSRA